MPEILDAQTLLRSAQELHQSTKELRESMKDLRVAQLKTDAQLAATDAQLAATDVQISRLEASQEDLAIRVKNVSRELADIGHSNGSASEELFFNALSAEKRLGHVHFDDITRNMHTKRERREDEYDIVLRNGEALGLVEVKYKANKDHVLTLVTRKVENFRYLFPYYADFKIYAAIAAQSFEPGVEAFAREHGVVVLKPLGETMQVEAEGMRAY